MRICVIGTGHVGLITCVSLAELGYEVVGMDSDEEKMDQLTRGVSPFFEPGVQEYLTKGLAAGNLRFSAQPEEAIPGADVVFICVGTPARATGEANLIAVEQAATVVAAHATGRTVVVEKSTVPAGTSARVKRTLRRGRTHPGREVEVVSNPEFLRGGVAGKESLQPH